MSASAPKFEDWFDLDQIHALSKQLGEAPETQVLREEAFRDFGGTPLEPNPLYRKYVYLGNVDLRGSSPVSSGPSVPLPPVPGATIRVVHDASGTRVDLPGQLEQTGVRVQTLAGWERAGDGWNPLRPTGEVAPDKLGLLARSLTNRAVRIEIPDRCPVPVRIQDITVLSRPNEALSVRRSYKIGADARCLLSEELFSTSGGGAKQRLAASTADVTLSDGAQVQYVAVHAPDLGVISLYHRFAQLGRAAGLTWLWAGMGGYRSRGRMYAELAGQGCKVEDLQAFFGAGDQAFDSSVNLRHVGTDTHGQSVSRGVFRDDARGVSRGLVRIEKEARKTVSYLSEHAMLLSRGARCDTIPVLEILCRDVKATHSSSVAPVDPERVFYLESRGLPEADAIRTISEGFLSNVLDRAPIVGLRDAIYPTLGARWDRKEVAWESPGYPALPPLAVSHEGHADEWRFDSKLT